jgi:hypothetical protein
LPSAPRSLADLIPPAASSNPSNATAPETVANDPNRKKLTHALNECERERQALAKAIKAHLDKREEIARRQKNKQNLDDVLAEQTAYAALEIVPASLNETDFKKIISARASVELAFDQAIKECIKSGQDLRVQVLERERTEFMASESKDLGDVARLFPNSRFRIINVHSGKALGVASDSDLLVQRNDDANDPSLQWLLTRPAKTEPNKIRIQNFNSKKAVNITRRSQAPGTQLLQFSSQGIPPNECWQFEHRGSCFVIHSLDNGQVIAVAGGALHDQAPIIQWRWANTDEQKWKLVRVR